jgi:hypothetical protein
MTQRTIFAGTNPTLIIKTGASVTVEGWDRDQVQAETSSRWGLKVEQRSEAEFARARAAVGDRVLFDLHFKRPGAKDTSAETIEVQVGGDGRVRVPFGSTVKVYAGADALVSDVRGTVSIYAGRDVRVRGVGTLAHVSTGGVMDLECENVAGNPVKFEAGRDLRCFIRGLTSARVIVNDLGSAWEGVIGAGDLTLRLKAGGDVILVTDQEVQAAPPDYILGQIEKPSVSSGTAG